MLENGLTVNKNTDAKSQKSGWRFLLGRKQILILHIKTTGVGFSTQKVQERMKKECKDHLK